MNHKYHITFSFILITLIIGLLALAAQTPSAAYAGAGLPPRATPVPPPPDDDKDRGGPPVGAYIELAASDAPAGAWAVVQWQDSAGGWHDVEGWRGSLANSRRWWVHPKDFRTGPFRWQVTAGPDGTVLKVSEAFHLPSGANETSLMTVEP
jgi:hypothetical protein